VLVLSERVKYLHENGKLVTESLRFNSRRLAGSTIQIWMASCAAGAGRSVNR
jgi:hypothetical protein